MTGSQERAYRARVSFNVAAEAYDGFMGRYSRLLSAQLADFAGVRHGQRAIDVGCGPGALTSELVARLGAAGVTAVDPSEPFAAAARARNPGVDVVQASAEHLPFPDGAFDVSLAQLVVHFMSDPIAGLREMARVTRPHGVIAACVWDHGAGNSPLSLFWRAAHELDPDLPDQAHLPGTQEGHLADLFEAAGIRRVEQTTLTVDLSHSTFDEWWEPYGGGVGPAGAYVASLDAKSRAALRAKARRLLPAEPFVITARAWASKGTTPNSEGS